MNLKENHGVLDLSLERGVIQLTGRFSQDRLIIKNADSVTIDFSQCFLNTSHKEDSIVIDSPRDTVLVGAKLNNALTVWGSEFKIKDTYFEGALNCLNAKVFLSKNN